MTKKLILMLTPILLLAAPSNPSNLVLTPSINTVSIKWQDNSTDESGFKIFRDNQFIHTAMANEQSFTDKGLIPRTKYFYKIVSTDDSITSHIMVPKINQVNEPIVAYLSNMTNSDKDWVGIFKDQRTVEDVGIDFAHLLAWKYSYTHEMGAGEIIVDELMLGTLPVGDYEARVFFNDSYVTEAKTYFTIVDREHVSLEKLAFTTGEEMVINFTDIAGNNDDWVGIYQKGDNNAWENVKSWSFTGGIKNGSLSLDSPEATGEYEARLFYNNSFAVEDKVSFQVKQNNEEYYPAKNWIAKEPSQMGWSSSKLDIAKQHFDEIGATAVMVIYDGYIIADWGDTSRRVNSHSIRKSFLSALFGIYANEGSIDISSTLGELNIDDIQKLSDTEKTAKVSDLLKARSGVYHPAAYETQNMKETRPDRGSHLPNTFFYYNNWDFNALGTIFEQETSKGIFAAFEERIAQPINMNDFRASDGRYHLEDVSIHPAYPFWMSARDRARFGLLYLRNGKWGDQQIIPEQWIKDSIIPYSDAGGGIGYGYLWWTSTGEWHLGNRIKGKAYSARGHWGQYIVILPEENLVIVQVSDKSAGDENVYGNKFNTLLRLILEAKNN